MSKDIKELRIDTQLNFEKYADFQHPEITKAECLVAYHGENRNGSFISKETFEKEDIMQTLVGIPVVGEYWETSENFKGHGGKIEISDEGIEYVMTTKPYGAVVEPNPRWVEITEEDGSVHEYLAVDVYLWTGRYEELNVVKENGANQSMEIMVKSGEYKEEEDVYSIDDFFYSALCILGRDDRNPEFNYEPCFESSGIVAYSLDRDEFKSEFKEFMQIVKEYNVSDDISDSKDELEVDGDEEQMELEKEKEFEEAEIDAETIVDGVISTEDAEESFELTYNDKREILFAELKKENSYVWLMDLSDEFIYYESYDMEVEMYKYFKRSYTMNESNEVMFGEDVVEVFHSWLTVEEKASFGLKESRVEELESELASLNEYKVQKEHEEYMTSVADTFAQFEDNEMLSESDEYASIKERAVEQKLDCDQIKKEVFALIGAITFENNKDNVGAINTFSVDPIETKKGKFAEFEKYLEIAKNRKLGGNR